MGLFAAGLGLQRERKALPSQVACIAFRVPGRALAGLFPAVYETLKLETHIDEITRQAALFKNLQDRFRQAATVTSLGPYSEFRIAFDSLTDRMDAARSASITPPERCFTAGRKKVKGGDYYFDSGILTPRSNS